ncbi:MAG: BrnA antitoxin family protein [Desulfovibrio sp.]|nr:BrnA antitoxin family protein [Desulfovibrio sp.]
MRKNAKSIASFELDVSNLPPLTAEERAELETLSRKAERDIDYSDIPAVENHCGFCRPAEMTTIRIDADVLAWLRAQGAGYESRINTILRREMLASGRLGG